MIAIELSRKSFLERLWEILQPLEVQVIKKKKLKHASRIHSYRVNSHIKA